MSATALTPTPQLLADSFLVFHFFILKHKLGFLSGLEVAPNPFPVIMQVFFGLFREAAKKVFFLVARPLRPLAPPPLGLVAIGTFLI